MVDKNEAIAQNGQHDIINPDMDKREFRITIGIRSYWITKEECEKYLKDSQKQGVEYVALRDGLLILPVKHQELVHRSVIEASEQIDEGRWQCDSGNWHNPGAPCYCNVDVEEVEEGILRIQPKTQQPLLQGKAEPKEQAVSRYLNGSIKSF